MAKDSIIVNERTFIQLIVHSNIVVTNILANGSKDEASSIKEKSHMNEIHDPIQEQLVTARRNQILDAATKVFAKKGFHLATIKDIAREAGIADGTIYNYFENKTALMLGILDRMNESDRRDADFSEFTAGDFRSFMKAYLRHRLMVLKADTFEVFKVVVSEILVNQELR